MPVKRKLSKSEYDALSDEKKEFYIENKDRKGEYIIDADEDFNKELTSALDNERKAKDTALGKVKDLETELETEKAKKQPKDGAVSAEDHEAMKKSYETKLANKEQELGGKLTKANDFIKATLVDSKASELANAISTAPKLMLPHIKSRLVVEVGDDGEYKTGVLDENGKPSAYSLEDLKGQLVANQDFAAILIGSRANGGGSAGNHPQGNGSAGQTPPNPFNVGTGDKRAHMAQLKAANPDLP